MTLSNRINALERLLGHQVGHCRACGLVDGATLPLGHLPPAETERRLLPLLGPERLAALPRCGICRRFQPLDRAALAEVCRLGENSGENSGGAGMVTP